MKTKANGDCFYIAFEHGKTVADGSALPQMVGSLGIDEGTSVELRRTWVKHVQEHPFRIVDGVKINIAQDTMSFAHDTIYARTRAVVFTDEPGYTFRLFELLMNHYRTSNQTELFATLYKTSEMKHQILAVFESILCGVGGPSILNEHERNFLRYILENNITDLRLQHLAGASTEPADDTLRTEEDPTFKTFHYWHSENRSRDSTGGNMFSYANEHTEVCFAEKGYNIVILSPEGTVSRIVKPSKPSAKWIYMQSGGQHYDLLLPLDC